jgi:hypothetical protein
MNLLHLSTSDLGGGAARSAYRLHQGLQAIGLTSRMLVHTRLSDWVEDKKAYTMTV